MIASVPAALAAAACFAGAAVLQQEATQATSPEASLKLRLLLDLLRRRRWLAGITLLLCGYGLQAVALASGPVALVQPIIVTELALAIPVAAWRRRRRPTRRDSIGVVAVLGGVAGFLLIASPTAGIGNPGIAAWIASLSPVGAVIALLVALATTAQGPRRAMLLGAAAGVAFGVLAVLTKATTYELARGAIGAVTSWQPYLLVTAGIAALVISQSAYQAGPLTFSMPFVAVLEPILAVLVGATAFHEQARLSGGYLAVEALTALLAVVGVVLLASSPTVLGTHDGSLERMQGGDVPLQADPVPAVSPAGEPEPPAADHPDRPTECYGPPTAVGGGPISGGTREGGGRP